MSELTGKQFLELLRKSKLLHETRLRKISEVIEKQGSISPTKLAARMVRDQWITRWQAEKLLTKRYKGFFIGKYRLRDHIGSGGMSHVYLAEHMMIQRPVALKVLPPAKQKDELYLDRFLREAKAAAQLDHPNIVRAYDVDVQGHLHYLVMEYVEGTTLFQLVKESGPLAFDRVAQYISESARGLEHAHRSGLIHRDVKPSNLIVASSGSVKVLDLGLALFSDENLDNEQLTNPDLVVGTADYLSPEQARQSHEVDHRADIYSLGCTMYYLICGRPPFPGGSFTQRILKHQIDKPDSIISLRDDCPAELVAICERMMEKSPSDRFESMDQIDRILSRWLHPPTKSRAAAMPVLAGLDNRIADEPQSDRDEIESSDSVKITSESSLAQQRLQKRKSNVKTPLGLWVFLAILVLSCVGLLLIAGR